MPDVRDRGPGTVLDPEAIARLRRLGGQVLTGKMASLFLDLAPRRLTAAQAGLEARDPETVWRAAHSLKSSAGNIGAHVLLEAAGRLEEAAEVGAPEGVLRPLLEAVFSAYEAVRPEIEALTGEPPENEP